MKSIAFVDNNLLLSDCFIKRDYSALRHSIINNHFAYTYRILENDQIYAFHITKNTALSDIYKMDCYVVKFIFSNVMTLHDDEQENIMKKLLVQLHKELVINKGYYNIRIPTHIVDLIKAWNTEFSNAIFCGGTVEELTFGKQVELNNKNGLKIDFVDQTYIDQYRTQLMDMTLESFKSYQGQYHISSITQHKAGVVYENWIASSIDNLCQNQIVVAQKDNEPVGFVTIADENNSIEGILSAVDPTKRELGAYKAMISYLINYAYKNNKAFVTSTQFDNFIVQGVWNSLGLKPFYSIYNFHIDAR